MIRVQNLTKRFGSFVAVNDISFHVEPGGVVGFLGPNGAGKTTTIRVLTCYMPASRGTASIAGFDVFRDSIEVRRRIGYLPESAPLYPEMRVREYLTHRGKLRGMGRDDIATAMKRVCDQCWMDEFINRPIGQLSKGMRQRVGLADALLGDPDVLILDEPTVGLDPGQIRETRTLIRALGERHTVLLSSHILSEVEQVCSDIIIIASGKIVASGSPQTLREQLAAEAIVVAELKGPEPDIVAGTQAIGGVDKVDVAASNGWVRLTIKPKPGADIREDLFQLTATKGWTLREMRRERATLEDFFVQVTAEQKNR